MGFFEAGMMICFGISWPIALFKTYRTKKVDGKSLTFSFLVLIGYILGILHKIFYYNDWVIYIYIINATFVLLDIMLNIKYRRKNVIQAN